MKSEPEPDPDSAPDPETASDPEPESEPAVPLVAYDLALDLVSRLREPLATLLRRDAELARRAYRALANVVLDIRKASGRRGRRRRRRLGNALGSLRELGATLDVAAAFGWLPAAQCAGERDRLCGVLYGLQRSR